MAPYSFHINGIKCSSHTISQLLDHIRLLLCDKSLQPRTVLCINAHIFNLACSNVALRDDLHAARVVAADGMAMLVAARMMGEKVSERCNMTEAFRAFLLDKTMPQTNGVLIGVSENEVNEAARRVEAMSSHCRIIKAVPGFMNEAEYETLFKSLPELDFIFLGMGTPKTERISRIAAAECPSAIVWGIGGGTLRILAGTMKEAPILFRRSGLQWLYRLYREPRSLWRRYLIGNPLFLYRIFRAALKKRRSH